MDAMRIAPLAVVVFVAWASSSPLAQTPDANGNMPAPAIEPSEVAPPAAQPSEAAPPPAVVTPGQPTAAPPARFSFSRVETGLLRLDTQTGMVALCRSHSAGWACEAVPEDRAALEKEIAHLQEEVTGLKRELAALQPAPPPRPPAPVPDTSGRKLPLVTDEDIARARAFVEEAWRRLVEMLTNFQKDVMRKT
jgi:hypothetical protein